MSPIFGGDSAGGSFVDLSTNQTAGGTKTWLGGLAYEPSAVLTSTVTLTTDSPIIQVADTTAGGFTINLPASPLDGQVFHFMLIAGTNTLLIGRNTKKINGVNFSWGIQKTHTFLTFAYSADAGSWYINNPTTIVAQEKDLGPIPRYSGTFDLVGAGLTPGRPVFIQQAAGPYTGKGNLPDEAEMDHVLATAYAVDATTIRVYWNSHSPVVGNVKFNYMLG